MGYVQDGWIARRYLELQVDLMVGAPGFEPGTSCAQGKRATRLRHAPIKGRSPVSVRRKENKHSSSLTPSTYHLIYFAKLRQACPLNSTNVTRC